MTLRGMAAIVLALAVATLAVPESTPPFHDLRTEPLEELAPGREEAPGELPDEVRIGWFGPSDPGDALDGDFWAGALLAVEQANRAGGVAGLPVRLVPGWSESPWAGGASRVARMIYDERVWAIVGSIDGSATHVAEQVVAKAHVTLISPGSTDESVSYAGVPWMFTLLPDDDAQAEALARRLAAEPGAAPIAIVSATDHDGRAAATTMRAALARVGLPLAAHVQCRPDAAGIDAAAAQVVAASPRSTILLAPPEVAGRVAAALREAGFGGRLLGGSTLARRAFRERAGPAGEGALFALAHDPASAAWDGFAAAFEERFDRHPDFVAAAAYDAVGLVVEAARRGGLNRALIRDALAGLGPWPGASGEIRFHTLGRIDRRVRLGTLRGGRVVEAPLEATRSGPSCSAR